MAAYDLGPVSRISMPSETRERKLGNLQRQQELQLAPQRLALHQQQVDVSKGNLALAQQQEQRMQQASQMQQVQQRQDVSKQVLQQVSENAYGLFTTTEEGSDERKRGMQGIYMQASDAFSQLGPQAKERFDAAVNQYGLDTLLKMEAQKYSSAMTAKRGAAPKPYEQPNKVGPVYDDSGKVAGYATDWIITPLPGGGVRKEPASQQLYESQEAAEDAIAGLPAHKRKKAFDAEVKNKAMGWVMAVTGVVSTGIIVINKIAAKIMAI